MEEEKIKEYIEEAKIEPFNILFNLSYEDNEILMKHPEICMEAVKTDGRALVNVPEEIRKEHPEICIEALKDDVTVIKYIPQEIRKDMKNWDKYAKMYIESFKAKNGYDEDEIDLELDDIKVGFEIINSLKDEEYIAELYQDLVKNTERIVYKYYVDYSYDYDDYDSGFINALELMRKDILFKYYNIYREYVKKYVKDELELEQIPKEVMKAHPEMYIEAVKNNADLLQYVPEEIMKEHPEMCIEAVKKKIYSLQYVPEEIMKAHPEMCIEAVKKNEYLLQYVPEEIMKAHPEMCIEAVKNNADLLQYVPEKIMKEHPEMCIEAVKKKKYSLQYVPEEIMKAHPEMCIEAVKKNEYLLQYVPEEIMKAHPEMCIEAVKKKTYSLQYVSEEIKKEHPEMCIEAVKNNADLLQYVPEKIMKEHPEMCIEAVKKKTYSLKYVSEEIKKEHPEMCIEAVKKNAGSLEYVPEEIKKEHPEMCIEAVKNNAYSLEYVPEEIKKEHPEMCIEAVKNNAYSLEYVPEEIKKEHPEMCIEAVKKNVDSLEYVPEEIKKEHPEIYIILKESLQRTDSFKSILSYDLETRNRIINNGVEPTIGVEWQKECLKKIKDSNNVVLSAPTGSGKTNVFLEWAKQKEERPIFITAPIKALSNQRWRELQEAGYTVGLETGDIKSVPENCDFICCTQEIYTNKYAEIENASLIVDEVHYIFENHDRARTYIDSFQNSKAKNILLCSATLGDMDKFKRYIEKVSNREFEQYEGKSRLTKLNYEGTIYKEDIKDSLVVTFSKSNINTILNDLSDVREETEDEEKLKTIIEISKKLKIDNSYIIETAKKGLAGYYGGLLPKEKLFIEECFEKGVLDTVVGTDALAMGVNFPVKNVVFTQLAKYYDNGPISKNLFEQLAGRAGRKGYFDEGAVYICEDFTNYRGYSLEAIGYDTETLYKKLLIAENEDVSINIKPDIKQILSGKRTIEEEAEHIQRYSTDERDVGKITENIKCYINQIKEYTNNEERSSIAEEFNKYIARVYSEEYSVTDNCKLLEEIIKGESLESLKFEFGKSFQDLLQLRKYIKQLPKKYRRNYNIKELDDKINAIDETALNARRGSVTTEEISVGTKEEQLDSEAMRRVLSDIKKQNQRTGELEIA